MSDDTDNPATEPLKELVPALGDTPVAPAHGIAAIALSMAMKYHDINTVKDGALYQQYKLEGKNLIPLHLDFVFADAERIERWLLASSDRIAKMIVDAVAVQVEDDNPRQEPDEGAHDPR